MTETKSQMRKRLLTMYDKRFELGPERSLLNNDHCFSVERFTKKEFAWFLEQAEKAA